MPLLSKKLFAVGAFSRERASRKARSRFAVPAKIC